MATYEPKAAVKALPPAVFGAMASLFGVAFYLSRETLPAVLLLMAAAGCLVAVLAPKAVVVTSAEGIELRYGRKLHLSYAWREVERVETRRIASGDYATVLRGAKGPLRVGPGFERNQELIAAVRAQATRAAFDELSLAIASGGYPRRSPVPLLAVLGALLLAFAVLMAASK